MEADPMRKITDEHLAELERKFGRIKFVQYNGHEIVLRKPKRVEVQAHAAKLGDPTTKAAADEQLAQLMVEHVDGIEGVEAKRAFTSLLEDWPYMAKSDAVGTAIAKLSGIVQDDEAKPYGSGSRPSAAPLTSSGAG